MTNEGEWIEWEGGNRPTLPYAEVEVRFADGDTSKGCACDFEWTHGDEGPRDWEIIEFRVLNA